MNEISIAPPSSLNPMHLVFSLPILGSWLRNVDAITMENLFNNTGLDHVLERIFGFLDINPLTKCRLLSKSCKGIIDNRKQLILKQFERAQIMCLDYQTDHLNEHMDVREAITKNWMSTFKHLMSDLNDMKKCLQFLKNYCHDVKGRDYFKNLSEVCFVVAYDPIHLAINQNNLEFIYMVAQSPFDFSYVTFIFQTYLHYAFANGNLETVKIMIQIFDERNIDWRLSTSAVKCTIMHFACCNKDPEVPKYYLQHFLIDVDINAKTDGSLGFTPLQMACKNGSYKTVEMLLERSIELGIDFYTCGNPSEVECSIIHTACKYGNLKVLEYLVSNYDVIRMKTQVYEDFWTQMPSFHLLRKILDWKDQYDRTPLHYAVMEGQFKVVEWMVDNSQKYGIDFEPVDKMGRTPLQYAYRSSNCAIVDLLEQRVLKRKMPPILKPVS